MTPWDELQHWLMMNVGSAEAEQALAIAVRLMPRWQPIETAPRGGKPVLLWLKKPMDERRYVTEGKIPCITIGWDNAGTGQKTRWVSVEVEDCGAMGGECTGWMHDWECIDIDPTHWMPLPEAPK